MKLEGLHILLTYQCTYECDHCFVWGSPRQTGTLTLEQIENIRQCADVLGHWNFGQGDEEIRWQLAAGGAHQFT